MDIYKSKVEELHNDFKKLLMDSEREIQRMPSGNLRCYRHQGRLVFRHAERLDGITALHGINRNPELIAQLARKEYLQKLHDAAEWDAGLLKQLMGRYKSLDPGDLIGSMSRAARKVPDHSFLAAGKVLPDDFFEEKRAARMEEHRKWAMEKYEQSTYKPEEKIHLTSSGVYVRSKSEALISEKLFDREVPNRYEQIIRLDGRRYAPDFTFQDASGEWFFWEHAGKMNETEYVRRHLKKRSMYERFGIVPWENLIITYDTVDGGINMALIDSIIRYEVLPRL